MSLKFFHYVFIVASIACAVFFGIWSLRQGQNTVLGWGSLVAAVLLVVYGIKIIGKFRHV